MILRTGSLLAQMQVAMMLLTRLPAGRIQGTAPRLCDAVWAYPFAGAVVGALGAAMLAAALALGLPAQISAALAVAICVLASGGLHEDGLADVADGFGGGQDRARKLDIMRDSRIGSYGTLALILSLWLRVSLLAALLEMAPLGAMAALIAIEAASRAGLAVMLRSMPSARAQGLGQMAAGVTLPRMGAALGLGATALYMGLGMQMGLGAGFAAAVVVGAAMATAQAAVGLIALRQIGGQTGDVLGAAQQMGALAAWIASIVLA